MKKHDHILLLGKRKLYWIFDGNNLNTEFGLVYAKDIAKKKYGQAVKTHKGISFILARPTIHDFFTMKASRGPAIAHYKDLGLIISLTGVNQNWNCLDAGSGTGFLAMFIANVVKPGKVVSYEKKVKHYVIAKQNAKIFGLKNLTIKNKDMRNFTEKDVDLITLDMEGSEKIVPKAFKALNPGGWMVVYSPVINQAESVSKAANKAGFKEVFTTEVIVRDWRVIQGYVRPEHHMLGHTAFLTFARKI